MKRTCGWLNNLLRCVVIHLTSHFLGSYRWISTCHWTLWLPKIMIFLEIFDLMSIFSRRERHNPSVSFFQNRQRLILRVISWAISSRTNNLGLFWCLGIRLIYYVVVENCATFEILKIVIALCVVILNIKARVDIDANRIINVGRWLARGVWALAVHWGLMTYYQQLWKKTLIRCIHSIDSNVHAISFIMLLQLLIGWSQASDIIPVWPRMPIT